MKKLLFLLLSLSALSFTATSQTVNRIPLSTTNKTYLDTTSNSGTRAQLVKAGNCVSLRIQANVQKISGTPTGNVILLGSQDGITFEQIPSYKLNGTIGMDTLKVTNVSTIQAHSFVIPAVYYNYYEISYTGSGTMACKLWSLETETLSPVYFKQ